MGLYCLPAGSRVISHVLESSSMSVDFDYPPVTLDTQSQQLDALWKAINRSQAIIEFDLQGRVVSANANFLDLMGYTLDEIVGQHHRIFCDPAEISTPEYRTF